MAPTQRAIDRATAQQHSVADAPAAGCSAEPQHARGRDRRRSYSGRETTRPNINGTVAAPSGARQRRSPAPLSTSPGCTRQPLL